MICTYVRLFLRSISPLSRYFLDFVLVPSLLPDPQPVHLRWNRSTNLLWRGSVFSVQLITLPSVLDLLLTRSESLVTFGSLPVTDTNSPSFFRSSRPYFLLPSTSISLWIRVSRRIRSSSIKLSKSFKVPNFRFVFGSACVQKEYEILRKVWCFLWTVRWGGGWIRDLKQYIPGCRRK